MESSRLIYPADLSEASHLPQEDALHAYAHQTLRYLENYAREKPASFGLWALGIGFVLGWKLKPW